MLLNEPFNSLVRAGTAGDTINKIPGSLKPQVVYFTEQHGRRGAVLLIDSPPTFPGSLSRSS